MTCRKTTVPGLSTCTSTSVRSMSVHGISTCDVTLGFVPSSPLQVTGLLFRLLPYFFFGRRCNQLPSLKVPATAVRAARHRSSPTTTSPVGTLGQLSTLVLAPLFLFCSSRASLVTGRASWHALFPRISQALHSILRESFRTSRFPAPFRELESRPSQHRSFIVFF